MGVQNEYGECRKSLNRIETFRRCTECRHEWGHAEEANDTRKPMLDDDGRDTPNRVSALLLQQKKA
jgi:hypothetical protein